MGILGEKTQKPINFAKFLPYADFTDSQQIKEAVLNSTDIIEPEQLGAVYNLNLAFAGETVTGGSNTDTLNFQKRSVITSISMGALVTAGAMTRCRLQFYVNSSNGTIYSNTFYLDITQPLNTAITGLNVPVNAGDVLTLWAVRTDNACSWEVDCYINVLEII